MAEERMYHLGIGHADLPAGTDTALLSGDPGRSATIATEHLSGGRLLSQHRGLDSYLGTLPDGRPVLCATSGMGAPSASIVVNELVQLGIRTIVRVGTCGSIRDHVRAGEIVIANAALADQGAADDIAPPRYPAAADPFLTVTLAAAAADLGVGHHVGAVASVDTFFEGQERTESSANPHLLRRLRGTVDEYAALDLLGFEMECGTLLKMGGVYGFSAGCVLAVVAQRTEDERPDPGAAEAAVDAAIRTAVEATLRWTAT